MIQVKGGFQNPPVFAPEPAQLLPSINRQFARDAKTRIQEKAGGAEGSRYLVMRSGGTHANSFGYATPTGAVMGASGPGVQTQEEGATIHARNGGWLTFRLFQPGDTNAPTGRWARMRQVTVRARHFIRDSVQEGMAELPGYLGQALQEAGW